jgi:hypothetical protein
MVNSRVGGGDWFYDAATGAGQKGVKDGADLNDIGLLITTTGRVTYSGSGMFYIDDGSQAADNSGYLGLRVSAVGLTVPAQNEYVEVTGISTCFKSGEDLYRTLKARNQGDIVVLN